MAIAGVGTGRTHLYSGSAGMATGRWSGLSDRCCTDAAVTLRTGRRRHRVTVSGCCTDVSAIRGTILCWRAGSWASTATDTVHCRWVYNSTTTTTTTTTWLGDITAGCLTLHHWFNFQSSCYQLVTIWNGWVTVLWTGDTSLYITSQSGQLSLPSQQDS